LRSGWVRLRLPELPLLTLVAELVLLREGLALLGVRLVLLWVGLPLLRRSLLERLLLVGLARLLGLRLGLGVLGELLRRGTVTARLTGERVLRRLRW